MKQPRPCQHPGCGQSQHGRAHEGFDADHEYQAPERPGFGQGKRKPIAPRSASPSRVQRYEESQRGMSAYRETHPTCEAASYGLTGECSGPLDVQHIIARGSGGGADHQQYARLCRTHHQHAEMNRTEARSVGLNVKPPVPEKVVPRQMPPRMPPRRSV